MMLRTRAVAVTGHAGESENGMRDVLNRRGKGRCVGGGRRPAEG